jgi:hypothetical protein
VESTSCGDPDVGHPVSRTTLRSGPTSEFLNWLTGGLVLNQSTEPEVGGGARLENIPEPARNRIQNFADKYNVPVTVVGSRAGGTAEVGSDWDYVIGW